MSSSCSHISLVTGLVVPCALEAHKQLCSKVIPSIVINILNALIYPSTLLLRYSIHNSNPDSDPAMLFRLAALTAAGFFPAAAAAASSRLLLRAQSSSVSAASYLPCLRYRALRFFSVVLTVGESTLATLCQAPYSLKGLFSRFCDLFSSRSSAS